MQRLRLESSRRSDLEQRAGIQDEHAVTDREGDSEIMRDQDKAHAPTELHALEEGQDLRLRRDIERGRRLIGRRYRGNRAQVRRRSRRVGACRPTAETDSVRRL